MKTKYIFTILIDNLEKEKKRLANQKRRLQETFESMVEYETLSKTNIKKNIDVSSFFE
jgi:hypothetical protein